MRRMLRYSMALLLLFLFGSWLATAQILAASQQTSPAPEKPAMPVDPLERQTPRSTVRGFLVAAEKGDFERAAKYLELSRGLADEGPTIARQLQAIMDMGTTVDTLSVNNTPDGDLNDNLTENRERIGIVEDGGKKYDLTLKRVDDGEYGQIWLFSKETVSQVSTMYQGLDVGLRRYIPFWLRGHRFLTLEPWQWIGFFLLVAIALTVSKLFGRLLTRVFAAILSSKLERFRPDSLRSFRNPLRFLFALILFQAGIIVLKFPFLMRSLLARLYDIAWIVLIAWFLARAADLFIDHLRSALVRADRTSIISVLPMMRRFTKILFTVVAFLSILQTFGIDAAKVWAGLGIGGIALALAAQKTVENLFGGISILADQPVRVGDVCTFGGQTGTVEDIGLRSTSIRTADRTLISIPNGTLATMQLENLAQRDKILFKPILGLKYSTTADQLRYVLVEIRKLLYSHPLVDPDPARIRFTKLNSYSLDLEVFAYIKTADGNIFLEVQEDLLLRIMDIVEQAGAEFAFPSQTAYLTRDSPINEAAVRAAEQRVREWRARGELSLPNFSNEQIESLQGSIEFPPDGSITKSKN